MGGGASRPSMSAKALADLQPVTEAHVISEARSRPFNGAPPPGEGGGGETRPSLGALRPTALRGAPASTGRVTGAACCREDDGPGSRQTGPEALRGPDLEAQAGGRHDAASGDAHGRARRTLPAERLCLADEIMSWRAELGGPSTEGMRKHSESESSILHKERKPAYLGRCRAVCFHVVAGHPSSQVLPMRSRSS